VSIKTKANKVLCYVSLTDKMLFTRHLAAMVKAGLALPQALAILSKQAANPYFKKVISGLRQEIKQGQLISQAMSKYPNVFSQLYVSMIKTAEETGKLEEVLKVLAKTMERSHNLRSQAKQALMYPAVIIVAMIGISIAMIWTVIPKLIKTFEELGAQLPWSTKMILKISSATQDYGYIAAIILVLMIILLISLRKSKPIKKTTSWLSLKTPILGKLNKKINNHLIMNFTKKL